MKKKRKTKSIYESAITFENLYSMWKIIKKTCKNKKAVFYFSLNLNTNLNSLYYRLKNKLYNPSKYHTFIIFEPKARLVMSQTISDKIINHFVANFYLLPYLESKLIDANVATRKEKGSKYAHNLIKKYLRKIIVNEQPSKIYCLKLDISKYFYSIDHELLLKAVEKYIYDQDVLNLIKIIISETNKDYINKAISYYNSTFEIDIPYYLNNKGLSIGAMSSQFLAIFYLNDLDHYIKEKLKCKYYIRYMDDFIIFDTDKNKLNKIWKVITKQLQKLKLVENKKSNIYSVNQGFNFLGYNYKVINNKLFVTCSKKTLIKIKKKLKKLSKNNQIKFTKTFASYYGYLKDIYKIGDVSFKMKLIEKYAALKKQYPHFLIILKEGIFYKTFYDDAKILWFLFDYKYQKDSVSFGNNPYDKVIMKLNKLDINYMIINKGQEILKCQKDDETYLSYLTLATKSLHEEKLIEKLKKILNNNPNLYQKINSIFDEFL